MSKMRLAIAVLFVVTFAAGAALSLTLSQWQDPPPVQAGGSWLTRELDLTPQQQEQMSKIWDAVGRGRDDDQRRDLQRQRDQAIRDLVPPERQEEMTRILEIYAEQTAELSKQRRAVFDQAVEQTKAILTDAQRTKYEELMARRHERRRGTDRRGGATTQPAEAEKSVPDHP
ncbi:MAG: Spy/CpxP family protein refolding chaperone [Phycisphaeraceae bacterium]